MRTTLSLSPDVAKLVKNAMREKGWGMKETVNFFLRIGFQMDLNKKDIPALPEPTEMGQREGMDIDNTWQLLEDVEGK